MLKRNDGSCRLMASITTRLSETTSTWARAIAPIAEWVAQELWASTRKRPSSSDLLPTRLTQRRKTEGRGKEFVAVVAAAPNPERVCRACGAPAPHGKVCSKCGRAISRENMLEFAKVGRIAAQHGDAQRKRSETQLRQQSCSKGVAWSVDEQPDQRRSLPKRNSAPISFSHNFSNSFCARCVCSLCR